jgi:hypothetical protein
MLQIRHLLVAAALTTIPAPLALARADAPAPAAATSTTRERCARAFIDAVNNGSEATVGAFEDTYSSDARRAAVSNADRHARLVQMRERLGKLTFVRFVSATPESLVALVEATGGPPLQFDYRFVDGDKLDSVRISPASAAPPQPLTPEARTEAVNKALSLLEENYVFPEVAKRMAEHVRLQQAAGAYNTIVDEIAFADRLTADLQSISHDKHLNVRFSPVQPDQPRQVRADTRQLGNFGFVKVEILPGNLGYVRLDGFIEGDEAYKTAAAAMAFVRNTTAVIFDLRENGGGSPEMIRFLSSYLFATPTHLNSFKDRSGETIEEFWTLDEVPGDRLVETPVFVLTSSRTFSGAEEFSYNLKNLKRGTLVGETTGGGAHPIRGERVSDRFVITVPFMRAWNPISETNWEGVGVEPDVQVPAKDALDKAQTLALEAIKQQ